MVADDLRRQADQFIDLADLREEIGRAPDERRQRQPEVDNDEEYEDEYDEV
jgi:uncharacterized LabA/DUF88 family protein